MRQNLTPKTNKSVLCTVLWIGLTERLTMLEHVINSEDSVNNLVTNVVKKKHKVKEKFLFQKRGSFLIVY